MRNKGSVPLLRITLRIPFGKLKLDKGLYSTDGFCFIDDSNSLVLNESMVCFKKDCKDRIK